MLLMGCSGGMLEGDEGGYGAPEGAAEETAQTSAAMNGTVLFAANSHCTLAEKTEIRQVMNLVEDVLIDNPEAWTACMLKGFLSGESELLEEEVTYPEES